MSSPRRRAAAWIKRKLKAFVTEPAQVLLRLEQLEERENPAPVATVTGLANVTPFLGETANFSFTFANTSGVDVGYSPFFDLILETSGPDGSTNSPPTSLNPTTPGTAADGFAASSGAVVNPTVTVSGLTLIPIGTPIVLAAGQTTYVNPFTNQTLSVPAGYSAGDTVFTYQLPFGSFTPGQNTLVTVSAPTSNLADVGTPLDLTVRPGFRDTDGNPNAPLVPTPAGTHLDASAAAVPKLYDFVKTYVGPENETATGPNYVRRYRLSVDIAAGQTIQNLVITDNLGPTMQLAGLTGANMAAFLASSGLGTNVFNGANRGGTATDTAPDGTVSYSFGSVTGVAGTDAVFEFDFFVPRDDSSAAETLPQPTPPAPNPAGGTDSITDTNTASTAGTWTPLDSRDTPANQNVGRAAPDNGPHTLQEHSVAVQKTVTQVTVADPNTPAAGPLQPGTSLLRYTIDFQVSDYYAVNNLFLEDVLGDGQRLYLASGFAPTLTVQNPWTFANGGERAATSTGAFAGANTIDFERRYSITGDTDSDPSAGVEGYAATGPTGGPFSTPTTGADLTLGTTFLRFNISDELIARGLPGVLVGGEIADGGGNPQNLRTPPFGPARGVITFWALAKREYSDNFPSNDNSVDQGDALTNSVPLIQGDHLSPTDLADGTPTALGTTGTDDSGTSVTVPRGEQTKIVYAINDTLIPAQTAGDTVFSVQAGDRITYKLTYTLPISRFEDLELLDIPPLPVMAVGPAAQYTFDRTFDGSFDPYEIEVAADDTFFSTFPGFPDLVPGGTITTDATTNTITMTFGDFDDPQDRFTTISLLVTLPVSGDSFIGDLFLTNQLRINEGNTFLGTTTVEDLRRIQLVRPQLTVDKGIVGFGNTGRALGGHTFTAPNDPPAGASTPAFTGTIDTAAEADAVGAANVAASDNVDTADRVRYAIVAQNTGFGDAYDVVIEDQVQPGYVIPATFAGLNLNVRRGDGTLLTDFAEVQGFARVATTGALTGATFTTTAGGTFTDVARVLDGVSLNVNEFVLVKNQGTASQNGVYRVSAVDEAANTVTLVRSTAFDTAAELSNTFVAVMGGTSANRYFQAGAVATLNSSAVTYTLQATTQDYYAIYDPTTGAFRLLLSDNYTAGNVSNAGEVPDDRAGGISRARATPLVNAGDTPPVTNITNGSNTVVVQYDLIVASTATPNQNIVNTARVSSYGTSEGGEDVTEPTNVPDGTDPTDTATAIIKLPTNAKTLIGTSVTETGNAALNQAVIGEIVTYEVVLTIPEGQTPAADLFDQLDEGLTFVDITNVTLSSANLSTSNGLTFANNGAANVATLTANTTTGGSNNRNVTFALGTITNTDVDNAVAETITVRYRAVVRNVNALPGDADGNQSGDLRNNSARLRWTGNTTTLATTSANDVTIREPLLTNVKDVAVQSSGVGAYSAFGQIVRADAGDNIRYQITVSNGSAATDTTAFDVTLSDQLPTASFVGGAAAFGVISVSTTGTGSVRRNGTPVALTTADFAIDGAGLLTFNLANSYDIEPDVQIVLVIEALDFVGATGQLVNNVSDVRWTSLSGAVAGERTGADGEGTGLNNYADLDDAQIESPPVVRKTLVATSEGHTTGADVAVGEIARFRLVTSIPEGTIRNFQISDLLPPGLSFLNDGTARWGFVSTGGADLSSAGITNVTGLGTPTTATAGIDGNQATLAALLSSAIVGTFNDDNVSTGSAGAGTGEATVYADGADVFFRFGDLTNSDNDNDIEYVVVEFNALVLNATGNQAAVTLSNTMTLLADTDGNGSAGYIDLISDVNGDGLGTGEPTVTATDANNDATSGTDTPAQSAPVTLTVREPNIGVTKAVTATTGTVVTYSVVLTNSGANAITAFNARVLDVLDGVNLTLVAGSVTATSGTATGIVDNSTGNTLDIAVGTLPVGGSVTVTYQANVLTTPTGTTTWDNTVNATATSLPGPSGTGGAWTGTADTSSAVPGASGTATGERTGADGVGGALNDYAATATQSLGSLGDRVYVDYDADGVQDAGEPGIAGAPVVVRWAGPNGTFGDGDDSVINATTGANGVYTVTGLPVDSPGQFRVSVDTTGAPFTTFGLNTFTDSVDNGVLSATTPTQLALTDAVPNPRTQDFGYRGTASIGDFVWHDIDGDGVQDAGEPGIPSVGVTVTWHGIDGALGGGDDLVITTTTNAAGGYSVGNLPAGAYTVSIDTATLPDNFTQTFDLDGIGTGSEHTAARTLTTGENATDVDFGYRGTSSIGDTVWYDADGDGTQNAGEPGIPGVAITLLFGGDDGDLTTAADNITYTTTTDANGNYLFPNLFGGDLNGANPNYRVTATQPAAFPVQTFDATAPTNDNQSSLQLADNSSNLLQDFGYRGTASLGDFVWEDLNGNGRQDALEPGIVGVTVELFYAGADGTFQAGELTTPLLTTTTGALGAYSFPNLAAGTYRVRFGTTDGTITYARTATDIGADDTIDSDANATTGFTGDYTLANGASNITVDAGLYRPITLGDLVWLDLNANGTLDTGEAGLQNVGITATWFGPDGASGGGDDQTFNTTTNANGIWTITNLPPGNYSVAVTTLPAGFVATYDLDSGLVAPDSTTLVTTTSGVNRTDVDFGYRGTGSLGDRVWIDSNGDGIQGPVALEPGLPAVGVTLIWAGQDNTFGTTDDVTTSTTTDQLGAYTFGNLPPGLFRTTVATGGGAGQVPGNMTPTFDLDSGTVAPDNIADRALAIGENATNVDFGYVGNASVGDRVWIDQDADGVQDASEPGVPGATVQLRWAGPNGTLDDADDVFFTTTTGANGLYLFPGLPVYGPDDNYRITVTALPIAGLTPTYDLDSGLVAPDQTAAFLVTTTGANQNRRDVDFGYDGLGSLAGTVYHDLNNDGIIQGNEPRLPGVVVTLTGTDVFGNPVLDPATGLPYTTTTDASGNYLFPTVIPGTYTLTETQPAVYNDGIDTSGTLGGNTTTNDLLSGIVVGPSQAGVNYNFGELGTFLSGSVFRDSDRDGAPGTGEVGIGGVTLQLFAADGTTPVNNPATGTPYVVTTDASGFYSFNDIPAGTYVVRETQPAGYADSPVGPTVTRTAVVPLAGLTNQNFGEVLGSLAGRVYIDLNNNGTQQGGENPLAGIAVTLTGTDVNGAIAPVTVFTDASGNYLFDNLFAAAGAGYTITEGSAAPFTDAINNAAGTAAGTPGTNTFTAIPLTAGQQGTAYNFGELPPAPPVVPPPPPGQPNIPPAVPTFLAGTVYYDADRDGVRDATETGIAGVTITLNGPGADGTFGTGDDATLTTTTDASGNYLFTNLVAGRQYLLSETQPNLYGSSTPNAITTVPLPAAGLLNQNFGETLGSISGSVYFDANTSGTRTAGEPGIAGVQVTLAGTDANGAPVNRTTTTDASGNYTFDALGAGLYVITEPVQPAGYADGQEALGTGGGAVGADTFTNVPLSGGANLTNYDFGEIGVPVSGIVFRDTDRDGTLDGGEPPIPGVTVQLIDASGTVVRTTTTDTSGNYTFPNVPPGTYTIRELQPTGYGNPTAGPFAPDTRPITVATTAVTNQNFGDTLSTLAGTVYVDTNNDGVRQGGETGILGVPVALDFAGADGVFGTGDDVPNVRTTTTTAAGNYLFDLLPAGVYRVREVAQPSPYGDGIDTPGSASGDATTNDQITAIPVGAGTDLTDYNFGELTPTAPFISGTVYYDANNNGARDPGEPGIPNVTVGLTNAVFGAFLTTTDANGNYTFPNLIAGLTYDLSETQPTGYANGLEAPANFITVPNLPATGSVGNNYGELLGSIAGTVYFDRDAGGALDGGDTRLPGVTVTLLDSNGAQAVNPLTGAAYVATTDASGNYLFDQLLAGTYRVIETQPTQYNQGTNTPGTGAALNGTDRIDVTLPAGAASTANNFGEIGAPISGRVYLDDNRDGVRQTGETTGLGNVLITLLDANGTTVATTTTANDGTYSFTNLPPGSYTLVQTQPNTHASTTANVIPVALTAAGVVDQDFGEVLGSLAGSVYRDVNANGTREAAEAGISGVSVTLTGTDVNGNAVAPRVATTDADGNYLFTNLVAGTYLVVETQPLAFVDGQERVGSVGGNATTNDQFAAVPLAAGASGTSYLFGELTSSLSGFVYRDYDLSGERNLTGANPDTGIGGITVTLTGTDLDGRPVTRTTTTAADGSYRFEALGGGTYTITETQPPLPTTLDNGFYDGADTLGSLSGTRPAKNALGVTLANGQNGTDYNFGELPPADPFGFVYVDQNQNGVRDAGEVGIPNVAITIAGTAFAGTVFERPLAPGDIPGGSFTVFTDANGRYEFNPIPPGLYSISEAQPNGYADGREQNGDPSAPAPTVGNDAFTNIVLAPFPIRGPFNFGEIVPQVPVPVPPTLPPADINKTLFLSSTPVGVNTTTTPLFTNSVARLGVQSPVASIAVAAGTDAGRPGAVRVLDFRTATERLSFEPYPGFRGGVRVAVGDVNGDGVDDVITAAGAGASPHVKAFDGATGQLLLSFYAYDPAYAGGVRVASGDVNGDGFDDVITAPGAGVGPHVKAFDGRTGAELQSFFAYDPGYTGGLSVAAGDVNRDGFDDIVVGASISSHVKAFDGRTGAELYSFFAFDPGYSGGVNVAVADVDGDGAGEVVAAAASGPSSHVVVREVGTQRLVYSFFAWPGYTGNGVRVASADINGDSGGDLIIGSGPGGGTRVSVFSGRGLALLDDFLGFDPFGTGGVFVG